MKIYSLRASRLSNRRQSSRTETFRKFPRSDREIARSHDSKIFGVGINDADYLVTPTTSGKSLRCAAYTTWKNMISRCYNPQVHTANPTYADCTVSPEWHRFTNFAIWYANKRTTNRSIDKDIILPGNKVYSPLTCMFVPNYVNSLFTGSDGKGGCPLGVDIAHGQRKKRYRAQLHVGKKRKTLGYFRTPEEAQVCYAENKAKLIRSLYGGLRDEDARLIPAMERIAKSLTENH